jgi:hypothetical protein
LAAIASWVKKRSPGIARASKARPSITGAGTRISGSISGTRHGGRTSW